MSSVVVRFDDTNVDKGPWIAGIIILAVGWVVMYVVFRVGLRRMESHALDVDNGKTIAADNIASIRRQRPASSEGSHEGDAEEDEEEEEEDDDDGDDDQ